MWSNIQVHGLSEQYQYMICFVSNQVLFIALPQMCTFIHIMTVNISKL